MIIFYYELYYERFNINLNRFAINLQSGPGTNPPNINFHFNARFDQNAVVKNNCKYGAWGMEERGHLPFQKGQHFDITIHIEHYQFRVIIFFVLQLYEYINELFTHFKYR